MTKTGLTFTGYDDVIAFIGAKMRASTIRGLQSSMQDFEKSCIQTLHNDSVSLAEQFSETTGATSLDTTINETDSNGSEVIVYEVPIVVPAGIQNLHGEMSGKFYNNASKVSLVGKINLLQLDTTAFSGSSTQTISREFSAEVKVSDVIFTPMIFRFTSELTAAQEAILRYYITIDSNNPAANGDTAFFTGLSFSCFSMME